MLVTVSRASSVTLDGLGRQAIDWPELLRVVAKGHGLKIEEPNGPGLYSPLGSQRKFGVLVSPVFTPEKLDMRFQMWNWCSRAPSASADSASRLDLNQYDGWRESDSRLWDHAD